MKILTILFLVYYIVKVFRQKGCAYRSFINLYELLPKDLKESDIDKYITDNKSKELNIQFLKVFGWFILSVLLMIIQFSYVVGATSYNCNKIITLGYLALWISMILRIIISLIRNKNRSKRNTIAEELVKMKRYKISKLLSNLIGVSYFGYMFFILFIR